MPVFFVGVDSKKRKNIKVEELYYSGKIVKFEYFNVVYLNRLLEVKWLKS